MEFGHSQWTKSKFERLKENDITHIEFTLYDQYDEKVPVKKYYYSVIWTGDDDFINAAQESYVSELGNLYIVISDSDSFDGFFDKEFINDKPSMDYAFDMYEVHYKKE